MLLMANSWTMATTRNGTRNQLLKACGKLLNGSLLSICTYVATAAPSSIRAACGMAVATKTQPTMPLRLAVRGR